MRALQHFSHNQHGLDWVVGDLHGCFSLLQRLLQSIDFQTASDRLFSVGDLVDRGPESEAVLSWLSQPWFYSVCGNHEQMVLDANLSDEAEKTVYESMGGAWFIQAPRARKTMYRCAFRLLPIAIEVATNEGLIGIVHADCPLPHWSLFTHALTRGQLEHSMQDAAQWSRSRTLRHDTSGIPDLRALIVGHTPRKAPETLGNVINIDTGAVYGNTLTTLCLQTLETISVIA
jgi:serine/threonine protein phosphatase 1